MRWPSKGPGGGAVLLLSAIKDFGVDQSSSMD
jgi:hypothetical protein